MLVLPPMAFAPVVSMGIKMLAAVPPMPAKSVVRAVKVLRASPSELRAGIMPQ